MFSQFSLKQIWTTLILFAITVPVTSVMGWYGYQLYQEELNNALTIESQSNELLRNQIEAEVKRLKSLLQNKSDPISLLIDKASKPTSLKDINTLLAFITERESAIREIIISTKQGEIIAAVEPALGIMGDRILAIEELQSVAIHWGFDKNVEYPEVVIPSMGRLYISSPRKHEDFIGFSIAIPIGDPVKAVLIARIDIKRLWRDYESKHGVGKLKTSDYMLDRRGSLITEINGSDNKLGDLMTHFGIARAALTNSDWSAKSSYIGVLNEPVYGTLTSIPSLNWSLISEVITSKITQPIWISLFKISLFTLFAIVIFIGFVLYLVNKTLIPIQKACEAIDHVAKGDYQYTLQASGIRELDTMSLGFNSMTKARQDAEKNLIESRKRYQSLFEKSADALVIFEDNCFTDCNQATLDMLGYDTKDEVCQTHPSELSPEYQADGQLSKVKAGFMISQAFEKGSHRFEWNHKRKNGEVFPVEVLATAILFEGKNVLHAVLRDITEHMQQEEKLRRTQKMDALGKLTGGIAHDYNNMLGIVLGYAEILKEKLGGQPKLEKYVEEIQHAGRRGAKLTSKLLTFSRNNSTDLKELHLNVLLQEEKDMLHKTLTPRIELIFDFENNLWPVKLDESELEDAILNMCINAMHAISGNGKLTLKTCNKHIDTVDAKKLNLKHGDYVQLSVTDTGCGMNEDVIEKIFDPFYSTKGELGTGLGLSQVYGFVKNSKGAINLSSVLNKGTEFSLYFPKFDGLPINDRALEVKDDINLQGKETILIIDDEPAVLEMSMQIVKQQGYNVFAANSAKQGLEILELESVDLLLSDVIMPEMDGYELASIVQEKHPNIKIQMVSGFTDDHHLKVIDKSLHENLLFKPYQGKVLLSKIRNLLG